MLNFVNLKEFAKSVTGEEGQPYTTANEYKLFFEGKEDGDYTEIYLNINLNEDWIELAKKMKNIGLFFCISSDNNQRTTLCKPG